MKSLLNLILVVLMINLAVASSVLSEERFVKSSARELPVSDVVDVLVVGGNEAGVAAAWKAAKGGASVLVLTENYFLSDDVSAKARYWLEADEVPGSEFALKLFGAHSKNELSFLTPWQYKMKMENLLRQAGAEYHFNTRPVAVLRDASGDIAGVAVANKAGVQAIIAKVVIDATSTGIVARMNNAETTPWHVDHVEVSRIAYKRNVYGSTQYGNFYEYAIDVPMSTGCWPERCRAEVLLRERYNKVVGNKAHAQRMHMVEPVSVKTQSIFTGSSWPGAAQIDLEAFCPAGMKYMYIVSQAAGIARPLAEKLTRPVHLADVGACIGGAARKDARRRANPTGVTVFADDASEGLVQGDVHELLYGNRRWMGKSRQSDTVSQPDLLIKVWGEYDIIVVGGGVAGQSAAVAAGRAGARVLLIEMLGQLGGSRTLGTPGYWRGYRGGFNKTPPSFDMLRKADVDIWYNTLGCGAIKTGNRVIGVTVATRVGRGAVLGKVIIDATGDGDICAAAGTEFFYLNDGDLAIQESSYKGMGQNLYVNVLPLDVADVPSYTDFHYLARSLGPNDWDFYAMAGIRETRLIKGEHVISVLDQITERTYADLISVSLSAYDPHGYHSSDYCYAGLMPINKTEADYGRGEGVFTYIPLRSLIPRGLKGLMVVGRCFSITHDAQASVRMQPDLMNQAYAGGYAAAMAVRSNTPLRRLDMGPIQDHLVEVGNITHEHRKNKTKDVAPPTDEELQAAAGNPKAVQNLAKLMYGRERSIPWLKASFLANPTLDKAKALCALGDSTAVPYLVDWLDSRPLGDGLSYEWDNFIWYNTDPDLQIECVMWLIGIPEDERAIAPLVAKLRQCTSDGRSFSRIRAIAGGLGYIASPKAAPALYDFLRKPGVMGHVDPVGTKQSIKGTLFSKSFIELLLAGALYKCGDHKDLARHILLSYLNDWRGVLHRYAGYLLYEGVRPYRKSFEASL